MFVFYISTNLHFTHNTKNIKLTKHRGLCPILKVSGDFLQFWTEVCKNKIGIFFLQVTTYAVNITNKINFTTKSAGVCNTISRNAFQNKNLLMCTTFDTLLCVNFSQLKFLVCYLIFVLCPSIKKRKLNV